MATQTSISKLRRLSNDVGSGSATMIEVGEEGMDGTSSRGLEAISTGDRRLHQAIRDGLSQRQIKIGVSVVRRMVREGEEVRVDEVNRSSYPRRRSNHHHSVEGSHRELE
jgi:hypothetical protein